VKNPFKGLTGTETVEEVWSKIGFEKAIGIMQCFEYFAPLIEEGLFGQDKKEKATGSDKNLKNMLTLLQNVSNKVNVLVNEAAKSS